MRAFILFSSVLICCAAGPATQPTTQPREETAIERAYRRLHARQAAEALAATRPASGPTTRPGNYPSKIAFEMNAVLAPRDPKSMTSAAIDEMWHSEQRAVDQIAAAHVGEEWELSARLQDVVGGPAGATAIFQILLPLPIGVEKNLTNAISHIEVEAAPNPRLYMRAPARRSHLEHLQEIRSGMPGTVEVEGALKDFSAWKPGGFYSLRVWTKKIAATVTCPIAAVPKAPGRGGAMSREDFGGDYLESIKFTCDLQPHPIAVDPEPLGQPAPPRGLFGPSNQNR